MEGGKEKGRTRRIQDLDGEEEENEREESALTKTALVGK